MELGLADYECIRCQISNQTVNQGDILGLKWTEKSNDVHPSETVSDK